MQMAEMLNIDPERCYDSYVQMAEAEGKRKDGIDFAVVVTPNHSHYEICKAFLNAGIHVACDKPVTRRPQFLLFHPTQSTACGHRR